MGLEKIIDAASGRIKCDLVLRNARIVNVFSGEIIEDDIGILGDKIVGIGKYHGEQEVDLKGKFVSPGFIDAHVHIESSMVQIPEFARVVVPRGTTSAIIDPHEIANVMGLDGLRYMLFTSKYNPMNVFMMLPSCVPATSLETSGASLRAYDLNPLLKEKWVVGLGEMMNYKGVINKDPFVLDKISIASDKKIDGHAPSVTGLELNAYIATGISSDHECTTREEALEKLRKGMYIMIREGTSTRNLKALLPLVNDFNLSRIMFCTDDRHPIDLVEEGHIDFILRKAIKLGLSPISAIRIATINPSLYFGLKNLGAIAPGYYADMVIMNNIENIDIDMVIKNGEIVAREGKLTYNPPQLPEVSLRGSVNIKWLNISDFIISAQEGKKAHIIEIVPDQIITKKVIDVPMVVDGNVVADLERDILPIAVIERHRATDNIGLGLVKGIGLKRGAIASSVAHDSHNIIVIGTNPEDMLKAVVRVKSRQGGLVVAENNSIVGNLPLPIAGLISDKSIFEVSASMKELLTVTKEFGCRIYNPFMQMSFLSLPVIPEIKITDKGIFDVEKFEYIPLFEK